MISLRSTGERRLSGRVGIVVIVEIKAIAGDRFRNRVSREWQ